MLTAEARTRLTVVLVGARNPQNIGAAARAMQDFGFFDLRVVNEFAPPFEAAQLEAKSAVGAGAVMRSARLFSSLPEAIGDCTSVVGTTAIGGRGLHLPVQPLQHVAATILASLSAEYPSSRPGVALHPAAQPAGNPAHQTTVTSAPTQDRSEASSSKQDEATQPVARVALLFGSEKTGLTNEQLSHCSLLLTIPLFAPEGRHLSMNLGQSVAVCLYELTRGGLEGARELPTLTSIAATSADRERLTALLLQTMQSSGYARRFPANARPEVIRRLAAALGTTRDEAATWMGLFKQLTHSERPASDPAHGLEATEQIGD